MANGDGESYDALVPIALVGAAAIGAYMLFGRTLSVTPPPGTGIHWSILGIGAGDTAPLGGSLTVKVDAIDLPHDTVEVWAYVGANPDVIDATSAYKLGQGFEPFVMPLPIDSRIGGRGHYLRVVLSLRKGGLEVAQGDPHRAGFDSRLLSNPILVV